MIYGIPGIYGFTTKPKTEDEALIEKRQKDCRHNDNKDLFIKDNVSKVYRCPFCGMDKPL